LTPTILQVVPRLDAGGAELTTIEVAEAIVVAGGRALVATAGGRMADEVTKVGGELIVLPADRKNPVTLWSNANRLEALVRAESVDLVHARSRAPAWSAHRAARRAGVKFVTTYHGAYSENGPIKRAYNSVMARGDLVIANSKFTRNLIIERYGAPTDRLRVINRGVDLDRFSVEAVGAARIADIKRSWRIDPERPVILHPARLTRWKGQLTVIAAAKALALQHNTQPVFILAGDSQGRDDYVHELDQAIGAAGVELMVKRVGHFTDMPAAVAASDVVVIASTEPEAFGRTSAEAQAMGKPVIATQLGAPQDTVLAPPAVDPTERTGWLVPPGDANALAAAVLEALAHDAESQARLADRARHHAKANFATETLQRQTLEVYDDLLNTQLALRHIQTLHP